MTKDDFRDYIRALCAHDYDRLTSYYTSDIKMNVPGGLVRDKEAIVNRERMLADVWDWTMDVGQIVLDDQGVALRATLHGPFVKDVPGLFGVSPKAGERWKLDFVMFYSLREGKIAEMHPAGPPPSLTRQ